MKKIIKVKTDKLFTILTTEVSDFAEEWGKSGIVNVYTTHTTIPIENGNLMLGKWQDLHFIELDPGDNVYPLQERTIICTFIEE